MAVAGTRDGAKLRFGPRHHRGCVESRRCTIIIVGGELCLE